MISSRNALKYALYNTFNSWKIFLIDVLLFTSASILVSICLFSFFVNNRLIWESRKIFKYDTENIYKLNMDDYDFDLPSPDDIKSVGMFLHELDNYENISYAGSIIVDEFTVNDTIYNAIFVDNNILDILNIHDEYGNPIDSLEEGVYIGRNIPHEDGIIQHNGNNYDICGVLESKGSIVLTNFMSINEYSLVDSILINFDRYQDWVEVGKEWADFARYSNYYFTISGSDADNCILDISEIAKRCNVNLNDVNSVDEIYGIIKEYHYVSSREDIVIPILIIVASTAIIMLLNFIILQRRSREYRILTLNGFTRRDIYKIATSEWLLHIVPSLLISVIYMRSQFKYWTALESGIAVCIAILTIVILAVVQIIGSIMILRKRIL